MKFFAKDLKSIDKEKTVLTKTVKLKKGSEDLSFEVEIKDGKLVAFFLNSWDAYPVVNLSGSAEEVLDLLKRIQEFIMEGLQVYSDRFPKQEKKNAE